MTKFIFYILLIFPLFLFGQDFGLKSTAFINGSVVMKNGDSLVGIIRLSSSPFDVRYKENKDQKKEEKLKFKEIEKICTISDSSFIRNFYYKHTNEDKFLHFVELIQENTIAIYRATSNNVDLFYENSGVDRRTMQQKMQRSRNHKWFHLPTNFKNGEDAIKYTANYIWFNHLIDFNDEEVVITYSDNHNWFYHPINYNNEEFVTTYFPFYNSYYNFGIEIPRTDYYLEKKNQEELILVGSKGNPLYKNFKKTAAAYFEDCPALVEKINSKEFRVKNIPEMIEFYNENCI